MDTYGVQASKRCLITPLSRGPHLFRHIIAHPIPRIDRMLDDLSTRQNPGVVKWPPFETPEPLPRGLVGSLSPAINWPCFSIVPPHPAAFRRFFVLTIAFASHIGCCCSISSFGCGSPEAERAAHAAYYGALSRVHLRLETCFSLCEHTRCIT